MIKYDNRKLGTLVFMIKSSHLREDTKFLQPFGFVLEILMMGFNL
jgi:hypothetical protein